MAEPNNRRSIVSADHSVSIRLRPAVLLVIARVRAAAATLDLGLAEVRRRAEDAVHRLTRLGASRAWAGIAHPDDQADPDPVAAHMRTMAARRRPSAPADRPGVNVAVAATWDIAELTAEGVLALVDRLRFDIEVAADADPPDPPESPSPWADPAEQIQRMMAQVAQPPDDRSPKFLYLARATDEQLTRAAAEAYGSARRRAARLAAAAGLRLGGVSSLMYGHAAIGRPDQMMAQQRSAALLATVGYELGDGEVAAEDPRATEVAVSVHAGLYLEEYRGLRKRSPR
jgi:hypothetical protein